MLEHLRSETAPAKPEPAPSVIAYLLDAESEGVLQRCLLDLGITDGHVILGGIDTAIEKPVGHDWPRLLIVDVGGIEDPLSRINRLAEMCDPTTEVIVVGDRNDIVLYRDLKAAGVAEYFFKPLVGAVVSRAIGAILSGTPTSATRRTGRLVTVIGVRGGVGATTVAVNAAWHIAAVRQRHAVLLDLNLHGGDAAMQLDAQPSHALREALDQPGRIDELFLDRGVAKVTMRLGLLAALEPLNVKVALNEPTLLQVLLKVLAHFRYVFVDLPREAALELPKLLHLPGTIVLVSTASLACARDVARWRELIGPNTPDRSLLHVLNKHGAEDALPERELQRVLGQRPDVAIPFSRDIGAAANLGIKAMQGSPAIRRGMAALTGHLAGGAGEEARPLWRRLFN